MVTGRTALLRYNPWVFTPFPRSVSECLQTSTATPIERAAIMLSCCRSRNLEANLVLAARWESLSRDVPVLEAMAGPLVRVRDRYSNVLWIDPVGGTVATLPDIAGGATYFVIGRNGAEPVLAGSVPNAVKLDAFWDLEKGEGRAEVEISGPVTLTLDWEEPESLVRTWAGGWCDSADVADVRILSSGPDGLRFAVSLDAPLPEADDRGRILLDLLHPPVDMSSLLPEGMEIAHSETDGVLFFPASSRVDCIWRIRPPEGLALLPGPSIDMEWEDCRVYLRHKDRPPNSEVVYTLILGGRPVIPEEYTGYRSLFLEATDSRHTRMVFTEEAEEE
jgi:hypothetical protein